MLEGDNEDEMSESEMTGLSDLSLLGAFGKLRAGLPTKTRELPKPSRINESFHIQVRHAAFILDNTCIIPFFADDDTCAWQCEKASYLLKINRRLTASQMFEGEAASQQVYKKNEYRSTPSTNWTRQASITCIVPYISENYTLVYSCLVERVERTEVGEGVGEVWTDCFVVCVTHTRTRCLHDPDWVVSGCV